MLHIMWNTKLSKNAFIVMISENYIQHTGRPTAAKSCQTRISSVVRLINVFLNHDFTE